MKLKLFGLLSIVLGLGIIGCQQVEKDSETTTTSVANTSANDMTPEEQGAVDNMQWVIGANAQIDADKALKKSRGNTGVKPELIAFSGRGIRFPGLTPDQYELIKDQVTYKIAKGSGDVIYGNTHMAMLKKLNKYSTDYNTIIFSALSK
ncbi:MAG: hypothetical protein JKX72_11530 [Robiginitomaculum sp.]|nr:hypothetical protein [Robiginitomaculum sp.]